MQLFSPSPNHVMTTARPFATLLDETLNVSVCSVTSIVVVFVMVSPEAPLQVMVYFVFFISGGVATFPEVLLFVSQEAVHLVAPAALYTSAVVSPLVTFLGSAENATESFGCGVVWVDCGSPFVVFGRAFVSLVVDVVAHAKLVVDKIIAMAVRNIFMSGL